VIPRYYQSEANDAVWGFLSSEPGNPLIVLPTGAGKSLVIAMLCQQALAFGGRVVVLQHRKELIQQNAEKIQVLMPGIKVGIFSAGLKSRESSEDVVCAGIQSVFRKALLLGRREMVIIDEAHLVSSEDETMYGQFLAEIRLGNPRQRIVGLTATPFRTGDGPLCRKDKLFQRIAYEAFTGDLIQQGFLCPVTNRPADAMVDTSGIKTRGGEFIESDAQAVFGGEDNVLRAVSEIVVKCRHRHSVLLFCSGVRHAERVAELLREATGEIVAVVTGETFPMERAGTLSDFKRGSLRWLVNCDVLTTGFDAPCVDAIAVLRATMSPGLFAQIVGRGLRKHPSKADCLVLDFGENIKRHGSLDDRDYGRTSSGGPSRGENEKSEANGRGWQCPNCEQDVAARSQQCSECGFIFPVKHESAADHESAITGAAAPDVWEVCSVRWARHVKRGSDGSDPATLRIDYDCKRPDEFQKQHISEWVCIEHEGFARQKAVTWWKARSIATCPRSVEEALELLDCGAARHPSGLVTEMDGKYFRIKSVEFTSEIPDEWSEPQEAEEPEHCSYYSGADDDVPF
jgi:DNA repair protein RadD